MTAEAVIETMEASHFPPVGELVTNTRAVAADVPVKQVADELFQNAQLDAIAIVHADPDGSRRALFVERRRPPARDRETAADRRLHLQGKSVDAAHAGGGHSGAVSRFARAWVTT
jgi:hypothetical protein